MTTEEFLLALRAKEILVAVGEGDVTPVALASSALRAASSVALVTLKDGTQKFVFMNLLSRKPTKSMTVTRSPRKMRI